MQYIPQSSVLAGYGDASFAPSGHRSHGGWVVTARSCPIAWRSSRQSLVTLSTAEAELIALQESSWLREQIEAGAVYGSSTSEGSISSPTYSLSH